MRSLDGPAVHNFHDRLTRPESSGLSFTVPDQREWAIVVEKPAK